MLYERPVKQDCGPTLQDECGGPDLKLKLTQPQAFFDGSVAFDSAGLLSVLVGADAAPSPLDAVSPEDFRA